MLLLLTSTEILKQLATSLLHWWTNDVHVLFFTLAPPLKLRQNSRHLINWPTLFDILKAGPGLMIWRFSLFCWCAVCLLSVLLLLPYFITKLEPSVLLSSAGLAYSCLVLPMVSAANYKYPISVLNSSLNNFKGKKISVSTDFNLAGRNLSLATAKCGARREYTKSINIQVRARRGCSGRSASQRCCLWRRPCLRLQFYGSPGSTDGGQNDDTRLFSWTFSKLATFTNLLAICCVLIVMTAPCEFAPFVET